MLTHLGQITVDEFVANYWQQKPLLIRQLLPDWTLPFDADDLAGMALEPDVESRIVYREKSGKPWQCQQGPFEEEQLTQLPESDWTLLIQGLDHWIPECADLLNLFRFLPNWRLDDIMASFAPAGGSVGPHYDQYDVFLLQAQGQRQWQIGPVCDETTPRLSGTPLRILDNMEVTDEWILLPGDCLYLPPAVAHYGVALDHCITLSVGFRSPRYDELLSSFADHLCELPANHQHLPDNISSLQSNPGEISANTLSLLSQHFKEQLSDPLAFNRWFGSYITAPKHDAIVIPLLQKEQVSAEDITDLLHSLLSTWRWNEGSRFTYSIQPDPLSPGNSCILLSADGNSFQLPTESLDWVRLLSGSNTIDNVRLKALTQTTEQLNILRDLVNGGSLVPKSL